MPTKQMLMRGQAGDRRVNKHHHTVHQELRVLQRTRGIPPGCRKLAHLLRQVPTVLKALAGQARLPPRPCMNLLKARVDRKGQLYYSSSTVKETVGASFASVHNIHLKTADSDIHTHLNVVISTKPIGSYKYKGTFVEHRQIIIHVLTT